MTAPSLSSIAGAPRQALRLLPLLAVLAVVPTACGGSSGGSTAGSGAGTANTITISNFEFAPETLEVKIGDTITVENTDSAEHSVTAADKSFDTGRFTSGTRIFTVTRPGRFEYVCEVHPFMTHRFIRVVG